MKLTDKNLGTKILTILSNYCNVIPKSGFMAGGAVANSIFDLFWGEKDYPINDIDIFYVTERASTPYFEWDTVHTPMRSDSLTIDGDGYNVTKCVFDSNVKYKVLTTKRDGILNFIEISSIGDTNRGYDYILKGFDLNCCQVGIDLETNELIYTKEFEQLLLTKQLDVSSFYTPSHTAIRIFKKIDELGLYCNVDKCMEILSQPLNYNNYLNVKLFGFSIYFSTKYKELYMKYYRELTKYFTMVKFFDHKKELWEKHNDFDKEIDDNHAVNWLDPNRSIPQHLLRLWAKYERVWTLVPKKQYKNDMVDKFLSTYTVYNPISLRIVYDLTKKNKKVIEKVKLLSNDGVYICKIFLLTIDGFIDCDFTKKHIDNIESFITSDGWVTKFIVHNKMNLQQINTFIKIIKKVYKNEGRWVSRLVEVILEDSNLNVEEIYNYDYIYNKVLIRKKSMEYNFIEPLNISFLDFPSDITIKEITSEYMLKWAGHKLKNCINDKQQNYKGKIESGLCRLFLIETKNNLSAMQIKLEGLEYKIIQLLSYCNKETSVLHKTIGEIFIKELTLVHLEKNIKKRIEIMNKSIQLNSKLLLSLPDDDTKDNGTKYGFYDNPNAPDIGRAVDIIQQPLDLNDIFDD